MPKSRPRCHCGADTKRNGTTGQHSSGWLRKAYATPQNRPSGIPSAAVFIQLLVRIAPLGQLRRSQLNEMRLVPHHVGAVVKPVLIGGVA